MATIRRYPLVSEGEHMTTTDTPASRAGAGPALPPDAVAELDAI
jgi:hypothetical protein